MNTEAIKALNEFETRCINSLLGTRADTLSEAIKLWEKGHWHGIIKEMIKEYSSSFPIRELVARIKEIEQNPIPPENMYPDMTQFPNVRALTKEESDRVNKYGNQALNWDNSTTNDI